MTFRDWAATTLLGLVGLTLVTLAATGQINAYLQPGFRPWVAASGLILLICTAILCFLPPHTAVPTSSHATGTSHHAPSPATPEPTSRRPRHTARQQHTARAHHHGGGPVSWFLAFPLILAVVFTPGPLGSALLSSNALAAGGLDVRQAASAIKPLDGPGMSDGAPITEEQQNTQFKRELAAKTGSGWEDPALAENQQQGAAASPNPTTSTNPGALAIPEPLPTPGPNGEAPVVSIGKDGSYIFTPLQAGNNHLTLEELANRWTFGKRSDLAGKTFTVQGFATPLGAGATHWLLGRYKIFCCAADALPYLALIDQSHLPAAQRTGGPPQADTWWEVTGQVDTTASSDMPTLVVTHLRAIPTPQEPYL